MISFSNEEIADKMANFLECFENDSNSVLMFDNFIKKLLTRKYNEAIIANKFKYPRVIKIAPSTSEILRGNIKPARAFSMADVIKFGSTPIWWCETTKGIDLDFGFENGDSRKPSRFALNDATIHGILAGMTGMGKSVALNILIFGMAFQYAPWELDITLLDAKAADLKAFGKMHLPHISSVAATKDTDYIISVLEEKVKEMEMTQAAITKFGAKKIEDFRETTGLVMPRHVIIIDEFQSLFKNAGKNASKIDSIIDAFSRLGRSSGYHLFMASQEIGNSISQNTLNQFSIRCCLGAEENVSEKILGNTEAKTIRSKGRLLVTTEASSKDASKNKEFKVPFQPSSGEHNQFVTQGNYLIALGERVKFSRDLSFYDENDKMYENQFPEYINKFREDKNRIYLGEPSFVMRDADKVVRLEFDSQDSENILVFGKELKDLKRYGKMLKYNIKRSNCNNVVLSGNDELGKELGLTDEIYLRITMSTSSSVIQIFNTIKVRKLLIDTDQRLDERITHPDTDAILLKKWKNTDTVYNELNRSRAYILDGLLRSAEYESLIPSRLSGADKDEYIDSLVISYIELYINYRCERRIISIEDLPITYVWILSPDRIRGWGRDSRQSEAEKIKNVMFDSCQVNVRFIIMTSTVDDLSEFVKPVKYIITDKAEDKVVNRFGASDFFPAEVPKELGVLIDRGSAKAMKFKKMHFEDEN